MKGARKALERVDALKRTFARRCIKYGNRCVEYTRGADGRRTCTNRRKRCAKYVLKTAAVPATSGRKPGQTVKRTPGPRVKLARAPARVSKKTGAARKKTAPAAKGTHIRFDDSDSELEDFVIRYPAPPVAKRAYMSAAWADSDEEIPGEFDDLMDDSEEPRRGMPYVSEIPRDLLRHIKTWGN